MLWTTWLLNFHCFPTLNLSKSLELMMMFKTNQMLNPWISWKMILWSRPIHGSEQSLGIMMDATDSKPTELQWHPQSLFRVSGHVAKVWCTIDTANKWQSQWSAIDVWIASRSNPEDGILNNGREINSARTWDFFRVHLFYLLNFGIRLWSLPTKKSRFRLEIFPY